MSNVVNSSFSPDGDVSFENVYIYGTLQYPFEDKDIKFKSIDVTGKSIFNNSVDVSGNLNVSTDARVTGIATFNNIEITGKLTDGDGDTGSAGQVLSTDGTDLEWINTSSANVGSASKVGVNLDSNSATTMHIAFVDATSGNEEIRVDGSLQYKPSTGSFLGITTFTDIHVTAGFKDTSGDAGNSGQVLSATGTADGGTNWINVGDITAGTASSISVNTNNVNKDQFIPFLNETSGSQQVRADVGIKYNPNSNTLTAGTFSGSGASLTSLPAANLTGTIADARFPATLPAVNGANLTGIVGVPTGVIVLWSGAANAIPAGWLLCDGSGGRPDLRNRFVVGAGHNYNVDDTGGSNNVTLSTANLPSHTHSFSGSVSGTTGNDTHTHRVKVGTAGGGGGGNVSDRDSEQPGNYVSNQIESDTHSHSFSGSLSGTTGGTGSGTAIDNRPLYFALCYIIKT